MKNFSVTFAATMPDGRESKALTTLLSREEGRISIPAAVKALESEGFARKMVGEETPIRWVVKSISILGDDDITIALNTSEVADLHGKTALVNEKYQVFAGEVYRYLDELVSGIEDKQLSMDILLLNLKDLLELAGNHFDKGAAKEEIEKYSANNKAIIERDLMLKETWKGLDQLIGDIDNGSIEPSQIKDRLEHLKFFSEVLCEV